MASKSSAVPTSGLLTPPMSPAETQAAGKFSRHSQSSTSRITQLENFPIDGDGTSHLLKHSVAQDGATPLHPSKSVDGPPLWDYQDLSMVTSSCSRKHNKAWQRYSGNNRSNVGQYNMKSSLNSVNCSSEESYSSRQRLPFHKRNLESSNVDDSFSSPKSNLNKPTNASDFKGFTVTNLPQLQTPFSQVKKENISISGEVYYSHSSSSDPIMPTLSPQPPVAKEMFSQDSEDGLTSLAQDASQFVVLKGKVTEEHLTPFHTSLLNSFEAKINEKESSTFANTDCDQNENVRAIFPLEETTILSVTGDVIERPQLSKRPHEELDESRLTMSGPLYDYRHLNNSLCQPNHAKRKCFSSLPNLLDILKDEPEQADCDNTRNIYEFDDNVPCTPRDPYEFTEFDETAPSGRGFRHKIEKDEKFILPNIPSPLSLPAPITPIPDMPSQMAEEMDQTLSPANIKPSIPKFIREEDLAVSLHDLDNIFDTSSSEGEDNGDMPVTPTKALSFDEYSGKIELSRMYPTPPSLEQNAVPSPFGPQAGIENTIAECDALKEEFEEDHGNLFQYEVEDINVWNPPLIYTFMESSKYDALTTWPSYHNFTSNEKLIYKSSWSLSSSKNVREEILENQQSFSQSPAMYDDQTSNYFSQNTPLDSRLILPNCEAVSPASSTPSYLNKNLNSIDANSALSITEVHPLIVNHLLSDTLLNVFKDHNFDCCCLCVCNMNIRGSDAGINLPNTLIPTWNDEPQYKCTCSFSAVVYRHKSSHSGLFYEDELEVTGSASDALSSQGHERENIRLHLESVPSFVLDLLKAHCKSFTSPFSVFHKFRLTSRKELPSLSRDNIEFLDGCEVCFLALEEAKSYVDNSVMPSKLDESMKSSCLHKWPYMSSPLPSSSHEILSQLESLKPLLQIAVHKKNNQKLWDVTYVVSGPLTWREFHRLAARGTEDQCEPQPMPSLLMGFAGEQIALSPFSLNHWHKLKLEPYSLPRDIAYIVVAPEHDTKLWQIKNFFRELSCTYESHNFGKHRPITKVLRDGIMRVGKTAVSKVAEEPISNWFNTLESSDVANKLKIYARICKHRLGKT